MIWQTTHFTLIGKRALSNYRAVIIATISQKQCPPDAITQQTNIDWKINQKNKTNVKVQRSFFLAHTKH